MREEIGELVRRVVGRVMAERGLAAGRPRATTAGGVHVERRAAGEPARPGTSGEPPAAGRGTELVTAECLAGVPDGGALRVPRGARPTPLAEEEAWRRGIRLESGEGAAGGRRLRVAVGADHGGYALKREVVRWLGELGHQALDLGTHDERAVDYPDYAAKVAEAVAQGDAELGVCVDGAGIGSAMAANKVPGVRAANCWDEAGARNAREHNFANVLTLGGGVLEPARAEAVLRAFLSTPEGAARHARRVEKIAALERRLAGRALPVQRVLPGGEGGG